VAEALPRRIGDVDVSDSYWLSHAAESFVLVSNVDELENLSHGFGMFELVAHGGGGNAV
jgi:hypothetical protein|tara:strand:+ start:11247 stop:11423 length:177 start_codon:yes stop_codon:yes gene_type:complete